jgi:hypothetical protein
MLQHYYKGAIRTHGQDTHDRRFTKDEILQNTSIITKCRSDYDIRIMEALLIKERRPKINLKDEGITKTLYIF